MKNPEEYLDEVHFHKQIRNTLSQILSPDGIDDNMYERLLKAFDLIQKDAYNQAIQDAIKNVELYMEEVKLDETSYTIDAYNTWSVDTDIWINKDSILKLKIK